MINTKPTYEELLLEVESLKKQLEEKKHLEKELEKSQILMQAAFDQSPVAMAIVSYPDFTFKIINRAAENLLLIHAENYINKTPHQIDITWKDMYANGEPIPFEKLPMPAALQGIETKNMEILVERHDGSQRWELTSAAPIYDKEKNLIAGILVMTDNTERKTVEQAFEQNKMQMQKKNDELIVAKEKAEENEAMLKAIINNIPFDIWARDLNHKVFLQNQTSIAFWGNEIGKKLDEQNFPDNIRSIFEDNNKKVLEGQIINAEEFLTIPHKGSFFLHKIIAPITQNNKITGLIGINIDITDKYNYENELKIAKEKAEESDSLKTAFINNMSHEVRTPLNAICGFSQLIATPNLSPEKLNFFSGLIVKNSDKLLNIITDIMEMSQISTKQITTIHNNFDVLPVIAEIETEFTNIAAEKNIEFRLINYIQTHESTIVSDQFKLIRLLKHLIENAIKFTIKGHVEVICQLLDNYIQFTITDTGIGISKTMQSVIFEPFRQIEKGITRNFGGNGLGLAIVKAYTQILHGSISLQSELNKGTKIVLSIPIKTDINKAINTITNKVIPPPNKKPTTEDTLLIVEDEYSNYQYLAEILGESSIKILYAADGQQAIDMCRNNTKIDLILMDIKMPIVDGHTATKIIKEFRPDLPIVAQTAYVTESEKSIFINDFDDYIEKPIQIPSLISMLKKYISIKIDSIY